MSKNGALSALEILIVDDEADIRDLVAGILADEGYAARVAKDADEALAAVAARRPQLILLDIWLEGSRLDGLALLDVIDNGIGLPADGRERLLEPYVTTREKGTGLGLAIVGKILEEHGGRVELFDAPAVAVGGHGAWVRLRFAIDGATTTAAPAANAVLGTG